ncbi:ATP-dependent nuclease [Paraburkholderia sediminicola]|uniref:ATP-dependent nuclease n=1 Tax=Paraburkholderia sediminicola TaxID=458836 RepID=UPI0038B88057
MHIEILHLRNFRGIRELDWRPNRGVNCLIGPGDSGKTTVLDAIELLLAERQNVTFDDLDFYDARPSNTIRIGAVISGLPKEFLRDDRYGLLVGGWNVATGQWRGEPAEGNGFIPALYLLLEVDETLEPVWSIFIGRDPRDKSKRIRFADRKEMAPSRLGVYSDRHLSWARGSALQRVGAHPERLPAELNDLMRSARDTFSEKSSQTFADIIRSVSPDIAGLGVEIRNTLVANLDHTSFSANASGVALHDGNVPIRCMGTGSSRLAVAALQSAESAGRQFLLVDELEYGLEPHRISLLVSHLRKRVEASGQVFLTTHSTTVLREVRFSEVFICRRDAHDGSTLVKPVAATTAPLLEAKRYVRDKGEALLARSVLVCEGQTEIGLLKGYAEGTTHPFQANNVALVDGGGSEAPKVALHLASLGYRTAILTDSDVPMKTADSTALSKANVPHFQWGDNRCTEQELFCGIHHAQRMQLLSRIAESVGATRMLGELFSSTRVKFESIGEVAEYIGDDVNARLVGKLAHEARWIKTNFDLCFEIGYHDLAFARLLGDGSLTSHFEKLGVWFSADA